MVEPDRNFEGRSFTDIGDRLAKSGRVCIPGKTVRLSTAEKGKLVERQGRKATGLRGFKTYDGGVATDAPSALRGAVTCEAWLTIPLSRSISPNSRCERLMLRLRVSQGVMSRLPVTSNLRPVSFSINRA